MLARFGHLYDLLLHGPLFIAIHSPFCFKLYFYWTFLSDIYSQRVED